MISQRLQSILDWVQADTLADIGCDHGLLCIAAIEQKKAEKALACDLNEKPLLSAAQNIEQAGLQDRIELRLGSGLKALEPTDQPDLVVIAGMGASTMIDILEAEPWNGHLLLSPHKDAALLRQYLADHGYRIVREKVVLDGHFYPVLDVEKGDMNLSEEDRQLGFQVEADGDYHQFLNHEKEKWRTRLNVLPEPKRKEIQEYIQWINNRLQKKQ